MAVKAKATISLVRVDDGVSINKVTNFYKISSKSTGEVAPQTSGGRNLLLDTNQGANSKWNYLIAGNITTNKEEYIEDNIKGTKLSAHGTDGTSWSYIGYYGIDPFIIEPNTYYTLSFDAKPYIDTRFGISIRRGDSTENFTDAVITEQVKANVWNKITIILKTYDVLSKPRDQVLYFTGVSRQTGAFYCFRNIKLEKGAVATPWTPAPEDLGWSTTPQLPTPTNKYLWNYEMVEGSDGSVISYSEPRVISIYGDKGQTGATGATGNGVKSIDEFYQVSTSNATAPTTWVKTPPTLTPTNKYLWNYERINYTNGTSVDTAKRVIGVYGDKGQTGAQGPIGQTGISLANGKSLYTDVYFKDGKNDCGVYNNTNNGNVIVELVAKSNDNPYSNATRELKVTTKGPANPNLGGVYQPIISRTNAIFVRRIIAKIPVGYTLAYAQNNMGNSFNSEWLTPREGTGKFTEYIYKYTCGSTGEFSTGGHMYIMGPEATAEKPFIWYVASCETYDMTAGSSSQIKSSTVTYQAGDSGTVKPTGSWLTTIPSVTPGKYLWSKTTYTYFDGSTKDHFMVSYIPKNGATGTGVNSIIRQYYLSTSKTNPTGGSWVNAMPTWSIGKYLWTRYQVSYTNPTSTTYTTPECDSSWEAVNEIQIGGRNLIVGSSKATVSNLWKNSGWTTSFSTFEGPTYKLVANSGWGAARYTGLIDFIGKTVTMSFYAKCLSNETTSTESWRLFYTNETGTNPYITDYISPTKPEKDVWNYYSFSVKLNSDGQIGIGCACSPEGKSLKTTWLIKDLKLEKGNKATDWTPAPEDVKAEIDDVKNDLKTNYYTKSSADAVIKKETDSVLIAAKGYSETKIENLQIGGKNLFKDTYNMKIVSNAGNATNGYTTFAGSLGTNGSLKNTADGIKLTFGSHTNVSLQIPLANHGSVKNKDTITISFTYRGNITNIGSTYFLQKTSPNVLNNNFKDNNVLNPDGTWHTYRYTYQTGDVNIRTCTSFLIFYNLTHYDSSKWIEIKKGTLKLELGSKATDWTPAPEDIDVEIDGINKNLINNYYTKTQTASEIKAATDTVTISVNKTTDTKIQELRIGGRNYLLNSDREFINTGSTQTEFLRIDYDLTPIIQKHGVDTTYTLSFDLKSKDISKSDEISVYPYPADPNPNTYSFPKTSFKVTKEYQRFHITFKPTVVNLDNKTTKICAYGIYGTGNSPVMKNFKFEIGNKATDWSPAPEDTKQFKYVTTNYSGTQNTIESWSKDGYVSTWSINEGASGIVVGDTVAMKVNNTTTGSYAHVVGIVTEIVSSTVIKVASKNLLDPNVGSAVDAVKNNLANNYYSKTQTDAKFTVESERITSTVKRVETVEKTSMTNTVEQFYLSTSPTSLVGGSWSNTQPTWAQGKYIWRRTLVTKGDGTTSYTPSQNGVCITGNTGLKGDKGNPGATGATGPKGENGVDFSNGKMLYNDPTFINGNNNAASYNNAGNSNVTLIRTSKSSDNPFNTATHELTITNTGATSPGIGGFCFSNQSRANAVFVYRIIAKIPVGRNIQWNANAFGTGQKIEWLTLQRGTGQFTEYICRATCGSTGSFSTIGYFYVDGAPGTTSAPVKWYVAYATCFDMTSSSDTQYAKDVAEAGEKTANAAHKLASDNAGKISDAFTKIEQNANNIQMLVVGENGESLMKHTDKGWQFDMTAIEKTVNKAANDIGTLSGDLAETDSIARKADGVLQDITKKTAYINFSTDDNGAPCIELGKQDNDFKVRITNTSVEFIEGASKVAYINNKILYIERTIIKDSIQIGETGGFVFDKLPNGNLALF